MCWPRALGAEAARRAWGRVLGFLGKGLREGAGLARGRLALLLTGLGLVLAVVGCGRAAPATPAGPSRSPSPSPAATATRTPTRTPRPSATPSPTATLTPTATPVPRISLLFVGNIVPARCVQAAIDEGRRTPDDLYAEVAPLIRAADVAVGTLNAALSDYPPMRGCVRTFVLVGRTDHAAALARAGFDGMSVATNHIKNCGLLDCGDRAFFDTLAALRSAGLWTVGAGPNLEAALQPVVLDVQGVRFAFVSLGYIEPRAFAGPQTPGIAVLTEENLRRAVALARAQNPDVLIALPHWGPEYDPRPTFLQRRFARAFVDAGVDVVVGNHSHVVQGMEILDGVPVFYSLGNFMFDQNWSRETRQGVMLVLHFAGPRLVGWRYIPTVADGDGVVHLAGPDDAAATLQRIWQASPAGLLPTPVLPPWP